MGMKEENHRMRMRRRKTKGGDGERSLHLLVIWNTMEPHRGKVFLDLASVVTSKWRKLSTRVLKQPRGRNPSDLSLCGCYIIEALFSEINISKNNVFMDGLLNHTESSIVCR